MKIRILSLGEIVTPNMMKGVSALSEKSGLSPAKIGSILQEEEMKTLIMQFKLGYVGASGQDDMTPTQATEIFVDCFVNRLNKEAPKPITSDDFIAAWSTMNPEYNVYSDVLDEAVAFNETQGCRLILLSYTNYLDMLCLFNDGTVDVNPFDPVSIHGIPFYASYNRHAQAPQLLEDIIRELREEKKDSNMHALFQEPKLDIAWIYCQTQDAAARFGTPPDAMYAVCEQFGIRAQYWDKPNQELLSAALHRETVMPLPKPVNV